MTSRRRSQRGHNKVNKARFIVIMLLLGVAVTIVLIDQGDNQENGTEILTNQNLTENNSSDSAIPETLKQKEEKEDAANLALKDAIVNKSDTKSIKKVEKPVQSEMLSDMISPINIEDSLAKMEKKEDKNKVFIPRQFTKIKSKKRATTIKSETRYKNVSKKFHIVTEGETLSSIAQKRYGKSRFWLALFRANRDVLRSPKSLRLGQKIKLPSIKKLRRYTRRVGKVSPRSSFKRHRYVATYSNKARLVRGSNKSSSGRYHVVVKGDTLSKIAKQSRVGFLKLYDVNKKVLKNNPHMLKEGVKLWIPMAISNH